MLTRGIYHSVGDEDLKELRRTKDGPPRRNLVRAWDERWDEELRCSTDKAWKFIYVTLSFLPGPSGGNSEAGLGLGADMFYGRSLHRAHFYVIGLVPKPWLPEIVNALQAIDDRQYHSLFFSPQTQANFAARSFREVHGIDTTEDRWRVYSWNWLEQIRALFVKSLAMERSLVFSAENC